MVLASGRLERFQHLLRSKLIRTVKCFTNAGRCFIGVSLKSSLDKCDIFSTLFGKFFNLEHPERIKTSRDSMFIWSGRLSSHLQPFKSNRISLLRFQRDLWILDKVVQRWRINCSRFGTPLKSGVSIKFLESLKSMSFNSSKLYYKTTIKWRKLNPYRYNFCFLKKKCFCISKNLTLIPFHSRFMRLQGIISSTSSFGSKIVGRDSEVYPSQWI